MIKKIFLYFLATQVLFIMISSISSAASCSNNWLRPSSQTMETEMMYATLTEYANGERYSFIKQGNSTIDIYFLRGALLVKGLNDNQLNYDDIFWLPTIFMPIAVLSEAVPQGPCNINQKTSFALSNAKGEILPIAPAVLSYEYKTTAKSKSKNANESHFKGMMHFTPPTATPSEDTNVKGYKLIGRTKPYPVLGSSDFPVATLGELRRTLMEKKSNSKKWTGPIPEIVMAPEEKESTGSRKEIYPFHIGGARGFSGFVDKKGQVIETPCIIIEDFHDDIAICINKYFQRGFINREGEVIFEPSKGDINCPTKFSEGLAAVKKDNKFGFIDKKGKFVIEPQFSIRGTNHVPSFFEGLADMQKDMKWGFIDKTGKFVIAPQFERVCDFHEGLAAVIMDNKKWGFINSQGAVIIQPQFDYTPDHPRFSEGLAGMKKNGKWGTINKKGEFVIEPQFDYNYYFKGGVASICKNGVWGFIDKTGKNINVTEEYKSAGSFHDGLRQEKKNDKYGYINKSGEFVIEPQFEDAGFFRNGVASVRKNGKWGLIDKSGKIFVINDTVCGHDVVKNGKGQITWPKNIKELCR